MSAAPAPRTEDDPALRALRRAVRGARREYLRPPPRLTVSAWADAKRKLSAESSAEEGTWRTERAEYQRGIMDAFSDAATRGVVVMSSGQVGKTEILNNICGFHIDQDPAPILCMFPTVGLAETWSKDRLAPMLRDTPALRGRVAEARSRDSGNTILHKQFAGGHLTAVGANAPGDLSMRPIRIFLGDEVDRYPMSAGGEGDPITLALKRLNNFWNRKWLLTSTPTRKGHSRIEQAYLESDQRRYFVPCPHCGASQVLRWAQVKWAPAWDRRSAESPGAPWYECEACEGRLDDAARARAVRSGCWVAQQPFRGVAGFHLNELLSPWRTLADIVADFIAAKPFRERLRAWVNTVLGETWEEDEDLVLDEEELASRREEYGPAVPQGASLLVASIDVQDTRLEMLVVGAGPADEIWGIEHRVFHGDPSTSAPWVAAEEALAKTYTHESGVPLRIAAAMVDTGGHHTQAAYAFCKRLGRRRVWACRGKGGPGVPAVSRPHRNNSLRVPVFTLGVDALKEIVRARLVQYADEPVSSARASGAGCWHFHRGFDLEWFRQLVAEVPVTKLVRGYPTTAWKKLRERNEALDLMVYALAALANLNPDLAIIERKLAARAEALADAEASAQEGAGLAEAEEAADIPAEPEFQNASGVEERAARARRNNRKPRRSGGWMNGWRR